MLNAAELHARLGPLLEASRAQGRALGVLVLGLDGLRQFNIQHGYEAGARLVARVHDLVAEALRPGDVVLPAAPGEFAVLLPGLRDGSQAVLAAARLLRQFEAPLDVGDQPVLAGVAIGIATCPGHGDTPDLLFRHAEAALGLARQVPDRMAVAAAQPLASGMAPAELREALQAGTLEMYLQPLWDLRADRIAGAEALARWTHPRLGAVSPADFVPLAETTGLVAELTRWSLNAALRQASALRAAGLPLPVSVNLSATAFAERGLVESLLDALSLWEVPPAGLVVEVTETAIIADVDRGARMLERLHGAGIRVAIDDFGVGSASFAYLRRFPATEVKLDRSFITGMLEHDRARRLVEAMVVFAHHLGVEVVAEGVEDAATRGHLAAVGCDYAQGYAIGRAAPAPEFIAGLAAPQAVTSSASSRR